VNFWVNYLRSARQSVHMIWSWGPLWSVLDIYLTNVWMDGWMDRIESNRTKTHGQIFLSQMTQEQTYRQGTCDCTSGQCDLIVYCQELGQEIQIQGSLLGRRRTARRTSDFCGPDCSTFSEGVSLRECSNNGRSFLGWSVNDQKYSWSGTNLRKFAGRYLPHILSAEEKLRIVTESQSLLTIRANLAKNNSQGIMIGDESWFAYFLESDTMFATSPAEMITTLRLSISCKNCYYTFYTAKGGVILNVEPKESECNQHYSIENLFSALNQVRTGNDRLKMAPILMIHIHNSICHKRRRSPRKCHSKDWSEHSIRTIHQISIPVTSGHSKPLNEW
jgi:hypothetical protein